MTILRWLPMANHTHTWCYNSSPLMFCVCSVSVQKYNLLNDKRLISMSSAALRTGTLERDLLIQVPQIIFF